ncbi:MAG: hypothetical protein Q4D81_14730 [Eubacteriales bacterium]|nr:hypothetical protein [Eubacteriales bacterium]
MNDLRINIQRHRKKHPLMTEEDIITLVYEGMWGIGYPISSTEEELLLLRDEMEELEEDSGEPLTERLSKDWFRLNLRAAKANGLKEEDIVFMFCESSKKPVQISKIRFFNTCIRLDGSERMRAAAEKVLDGGYIPSHSVQYCKAYDPAYRVLHKDYLNFVQMMQRKQKGFSQIRISYESMFEAADAYPWVEGMIKCFYLYQDEELCDMDEASRSDPFQLLILNYNEIIKGYDKDKLIKKHAPDCALQFLSRDGADIILEQCSGLQGPIPDLRTQSRGGLFDCLCFILALAKPLKPFRAICYHNRDGSDFLQITRAEYDKIVIHFEQFQEEEGDSITADWVIAPECVSKRHDSPADEVVRGDITDRGKTMGQELEIDIHIGYKEHLAQAKQIVADMIKLYYLDRISRSQSKYEVYDTFLRKRETLREYPVSKLLDEHPDCALKSLTSDGKDIHIRQCAEMQGCLPPVDSDCPGFLYDVSIAIWRELPTTPMNAESRLTMTDTGHVEKNEACYDGEKLTITKTTYFLDHDDDCLQSSADWKMLPRCISVKGEDL